MELAWLRRKCEEAAIKLARQAHTSSIAIRLSALMLAFFSGGVADLPSLARWVLGIMAIALQAVLMFAEYKIPADLLESAVKAEDQMRNLTSAVKEIEGDFTYIAKLYALSCVLDESVAKVMATGQTISNSLCQKLIDLLINERDALLGFGTERWNVAIYLYDPETNLLDCKACRHWRCDEEDRPHRSWPSGVGHVGIAFQRQSEMIAPDLQAPEVAHVFAASGNLVRDGDRERYRSIASIPILTTASSAIGAVVATSDFKGRFSSPNGSTRRNNVDGLRLLAKSLALVDLASKTRN